jgi:hypothetical protein
MPTGMCHFASSKLVILNIKQPPARDNVNPFTLPVNHLPQGPPQQHAKPLNHDDDDVSFLLEDMEEGVEVNDNVPSGMSQVPHVTPYMPSTMETTVMQKEGNAYHSNEINNVTADDDEDFSFLLNDIDMDDGVEVNHNIPPTPSTNPPHLLALNASKQATHFQTPAQQIELTRGTDPRQEVVSHDMSDEEDYSLLLMDLDNEGEEVNNNVTTKQDSILSAQSSLPRQYESQPSTQLRLSEVRTKPLTFAPPEPVAEKKGPLDYFKNKVCSKRKGTAVEYDSSRKKHSAAAKASSVSYPSTSSSSTSFLARPSTPKTTLSPKHTPLSQKLQHSVSLTTTPIPSRPNLYPSASKASSSTVMLDRKSFLSMYILIQCS